VNSPFVVRFDVSIIDEGNAKLGYEFVKLRKVLGVWTGHA